MHIPVGTVMSRVCRVRVTLRRFLDWVESGAGYALVGALPRERLLALAEAIYRQHPVAVAAGTAGSAPASGAR